MLMDLLFELATWHALAKLRLHTETTVCDLEASTHRLGVQMREFEKEVCSMYETKELQGEEAARKRRAAATKSKDPAKKPLTASKAKAIAKVKEGPTSQAKLKKLNLHTYKFHALGAYARAIRLYGTSDSYSSQIVYFPLFFHSDFLHTYCRASRSTRDPSDYIFVSPEPILLLELPNRLPASVICIS